MYCIKRIELEEFKLLEERIKKQTIFQTSLWIEFLIKDQNIEPVILKILNEGILIGVFVGGLINKFGFKILGSPFEGWFTPDMGFIQIEDMDYTQAVEKVKEFTFKELGVCLIRIIDKNIQEINVKGKILDENFLRLKILDNEEDMLNSLTKKGRKSVRQSNRKGTIFKRVPFNQAFIDEYYKQIEDVFKKQRLKPNYSKEKIIHMSEVFEKKQDLVFAYQAVLPDKTVIASRFSFIFKEWAYAMGSASYREYQYLRPNEGIYWEFIKETINKKAKFIDMVGYREYKLKYNPELVKEPIILFEKYPGIINLMYLAKKFIIIFRKIKGKILLGN